MTQAPYELDIRRAHIVLESIKEVCRFRGWALIAAHVRCNHVHVVLDGEDAPEKMLNAFKSYASRALNDAGLDRPGRRRWSRHGSTRYLWHREQVEDAVAYVLDKQGEPLAAFKSTAP